MILTRLKQAIRDQNWFAVVLEVMIVVLGVVIGFQVTAWGQMRADRSKEQVYLYQLVEELKETELDVSGSDAREAVSSFANASLFHAFYQLEPPSADSLTDLLRISNATELPHPVLGTAEALVATGDLNLILDDSLRTAITRYIDGTRSRTAELAEHSVHWNDALSRLWSGFDPNSVIATLPDSLVDSLTETDLFYLPRGARVDLSPIDREKFLSDTDARYAIYEMLRAKRNMLWLRAAMREEAVTLREQIEVELNQ